MRLVKLVRDRIDEHFPSLVVHYQEVFEEDAHEILVDKLFEEVREYDKERSIEELADVLEVVKALALHHEGGMQRLDSVADHKRVIRGGFSRMIGMFVKDAP